MKYLIIIFIFFISGCIKDTPDETHYIADLTNNSQHSIIILFYKGGIVYPTDTIN